MNTIQINSELLHKLRMLADWQVRTMGICPDSVTMACSLVDEAKEAAQTKTVMARVNASYAEAQS